MCRAGQHKGCHRGNREFAVSLATARTNATPAKNPHGKGKRKNWEDRIRDFMKDFTCPENDIERIIAETKNRTTEKDSDEKKYQIAYNKFVPIMMSI